MFNTIKQTNKTISNLHYSTYKSFLINYRIIKLYSFYLIYFSNKDNKIFKVNLNKKHIFFKKYNKNIIIRKKVLTFINKNINQKRVFSKKPLQTYQVLKMLNNRLFNSVFSKNFII